jgi:hypothetical protein
VSFKQSAEGIFRHAKTEVSYKNILHTSNSLSWFEAANLKGGRKVAGER